MRRLVLVALTAALVVLPAVAAWAPKIAGVQIG